MKKIVGMFIFSLTLCVFVSATLFHISKSRTFQFFGEIIPRVGTDKKVIALTFDDAPTVHTAEVLAILKKEQVHATFFAIGQNIEKEPSLAKQIVIDGHQLANHSYTHPRFLLKSSAFVEQEIEKTNTLIRASGFSDEIMFRPPNGKKLFSLPWYLSQHAIKTIMWDVEPDTYVGDLAGSERTNFLVTYTLAHAKPGSIILLHPFCKDCESDRKAIPQIISSLKKQGFTFVTVATLLSYRN